MSDDSQEREKDSLPSFGEQDLSDDLFAEYLFRVGEGEEIDVEKFLSARGFSEIAVETFRREIRGYETYRKLLQARSLDGQRVGPYKLIRELGRGGMGRVFLAEDSRDKRQVAIKLLTSFEPGNLQAQQRFRREYEMVTKLHHPHIVPMYEAGETDGFRYYAMEYIPGFTLDQLVTRIKARDVSRIRTEEVAEAVGGKGELWRGDYIDWVCWVFTGVGEALTHAHRRRIIHRDIKPSNILLSPSGRPYLFDFGLALGTRGTRITRSGEVLGTPAYMAPEQIQGGKSPIDQRTDVYGLGAALYELLTMHPPFEAETAQEVAHRILLDPPTSMRKYNPAIPAALEAVVLKALSKDPARRYQTARAMVQDLNNYMAYRPTLAKPVNITDRVRVYARKNPGIAAASLAGILLLLPFGYMVSNWRAASVESREVECTQWIHKGTGALALGNYSKALGFFDQAVVRNPKDPIALALRGLTREKGFQDRSAALEDYRHALDLRPGNKGVGALQAALLGQFSPLSDTEELGVESWDYFFQGLLEYSVANDYAKAAQSFSRALDKERSHSLALLLRGICYQKMEMWLESRLDLNAYLYLESKDPVGFLCLSKTLFSAGQEKLAQQNLDQGINLIRQNYDGWGHLESSLDPFLPRNRKIASNASNHSEPSGN